MNGRNLKIGLEIHQQLDCRKLFCNCSSELSETYGAEIIRMLRPTQSELGDIDKAAVEEAKKNLRFKYQVVDNCCLVELDEEPPHNPNEEAINIALTIAKMLNADIVDEINFMRKLVIDGSNTAGFQRTALIAINGKIDGVKIQTVCLEEDAARKIEEIQGEIVYKLDRLGIPLVEIATAPSIEKPEKAKEVAERIGLLLRATKKVKRGIGTIRQDLNISIDQGARVEIKGVQDLNSIPKVIEKEVLRQTSLVDLKNTLAKRGIYSATQDSTLKCLPKNYRLQSIKSIDTKITDVSEVFKNTNCKIIKNLLQKGIFGLKLAGFGGLLTSALPCRLGKEFAAKIKYLGIKGLIHSDENLPDYGISVQEIDQVKKILEIKDNKDAFIIIGEEKAAAEKAFEKILERAEICLSRVPEEVRRALPDNTTEYMRPMPGAARMYPETDVLPVRAIEKIKQIKLPEMPERKISRFCKKYKISKEQAKQIIGLGWEDSYEKFVKKYDPSIIARTFLHTIPELEKISGLDIAKITDKRLDEIFNSVARGVFAKEGIPEILTCMIRDNITIEKAVKKTALGAISQKKLEEIIEAIIEERKELVKEKGEAAFGPLMGFVMENVRGKIDGKLIASVLRKRLSAYR